MANQFCRNQFVPCFHGYKNSFNDFNCNLILVSMINDVVNRNLDVFLKELMPVIEKALASVFQETGNAIVNSYPYDELFPQ